MKDLLQHADCLAYGRTVWIRPEVTAFAVDRTSVVTHAGKRTLGNFQIRVAFVVPKENVVFRVERLDEVVFQKKRFGFGAHDGCFEPRDFLHHQGDARTLPGLAKIA